jgi:hypothetical protein
MPSFLELVDSQDSTLFAMQSKAPGPQGQLPITAEMLLNSPSGNMFAWSRTRRPKITRESLETASDWGLLNDMERTLFPERTAA